MRDDYFTNTEADAGLYERQRAQDDYDPPEVDEPCTCQPCAHQAEAVPGWLDLAEDCPEHAGQPDCTCNPEGDGPEPDCAYHAWYLRWSRA